MLKPLQRLLAAAARVAHPTRCAGAAPPPLSIQPSTVGNSAWARTRRGTVITTVKKPLITTDTTIFAMGSCFAVEIRAALRERGFVVLPRYFDLAIDPARQRVGRLPERDNINHYDTFTIRQEFEMAFGQRATCAEDFWEVTSPKLRATVSLAGSGLFQDPHRSGVLAASPADLLDLSAKLDACIGQGIREAGVYVITLGLIEVWRNRRTGRYLCRSPEPGQEQDAEFVLSDFQSNLENIRRVCRLITDHAPQKPIILTVSPVPLAHTFTAKDVIVANTESKCLLRTVAGQMEREFANVTYWPSYEIAMREDLYQDDGRHVRPDGVAKIIDAFIQTHCQT